MAKFIVYQTYTEVLSLEVEAEDEESAIEYARAHEDELESIGDDDYEYSAEEL